MGSEEMEKMEEEKRIKWEKMLEDLEEQCSTPLEKLYQLADDMVSDMETGLKSSCGGKGEGCDVKMLITYVHTLPTGDEKGVFYGLDLGGTNFRVLRVKLGGNASRVVHKDSVEVPIPQNLMVGSSKELFDYIAAELDRFVSTEDEDLADGVSKLKEIGFTFSFPVDQTSISCGKLIEWTKGFSIKDTVGKDVVAEINKAIQRRGLQMRVTALVNDAVGTLAGARYYNNDVIAAIILGTGTNASYVEDASAIPKLDGLLPASGKMVINMEWGGFRSPNLPLTEFDEAVDMESLNKGEQIFEKLVSGMYLGEIVRRVLLKMAEEAAFFGETVPPNLKYKLNLTPHMAWMHEDSSPDLDVVGERLRLQIGVEESSYEVRQAVVKVCDIVAKRGARLAGAAIMGILKKLGIDGKERMVVAVDGGLYKNYRSLRNYLDESIKEMVGDEYAQNVVIMLANDASGIGAALVVAAQSTLQANVC